MFDSEQEMQCWLKKKFEENLSLGDLIINIEKFEKFTSDSSIEKKFFYSFEYCLKALWTNILLSSDENIAINKEKILKPDFTFYDEGTESILIVELKNQKNASRQTGTELGAYANEIKSYFPFLSDGDLVNVIISRDWSTLLKSYIFHEIFWLNRNIICLEPIEKDGEKKLQIIDICSFCKNISIESDLKKLGGFQICLYQYEQLKSKKCFPYFPSVYPSLEQMKTTMELAVKVGNIHKNNGFAFLWKNLSENLLSPYNITIVNISAYQHIFENTNILHNNFTEKLLSTIRDSNGHGGSLFAITTKIKKTLENFCTPTPEGMTTWKELYKFMKGHKIVAFYPWGEYEDLFLERIIEKYKKRNFKIKIRDPQEGIEFIKELLGSEFENLNEEVDLMNGKIEDNLPF